MKKNFTLAFISIISCVSLVSAQVGKITLNKGQQLKVTSTVKANITQDMMGQSMETVMDVANEKSITVKDIIGADYALTATTTHIKMSMSLMGQDKTFDSNNKDDMTGELKDIGKDINKPIALILSQDGKCKTSATASPEKPATDGNAMNGMMQQMLGGSAEELTAATYFMVIPQYKKSGDSWTETLTTGTTTVTWQYSWESTIDNNALITATAKESSIGTMNFMGMDMKVTMNNDITESRKVNLASGIVTSNTSIKKVNGTIDVMGQSVPVTGTSTTTVTVQ